MVKDCARSFLLAILLAAIPVTGWAQDAKAVTFGASAEPVGASVAW